MKIDLERYRAYLGNLVEQNVITNDTAASYFSCMRQIDRKCDGQLSAKSLKTFLSRTLEDRRQFLKYVASIRKYEEGVLKQSKALLFGEPEVELYKLFKERGNIESSPGTDLTEDTTLRKINGLRDEKLKYALRLQLKSGLRVSEIAALQKKDLTFEDGSIKIHVCCGKGRKAREVNVLEDNYLYHKLQLYVKEKDNNERLFYTKDFLKHKVVAYGIETHDLRRLNAQKRFDIELKKGKCKRESKRVVQKELGHESVSTTNIYLKKKQGRGRSNEFPRG